MGLNKLVDFSTAKLLKDKGFDKLCSDFFNIHGTLIHFSGLIPYPCNDQRFPKSISYASPTIAEVVMWLCEKQEVWVVVNTDINKNWYFELYNLKDKRNAEILIADSFVLVYKTPTEAYTEAILYTLKNLI